MSATPSRLLLRTAAWYGDEDLFLPVPESWTLEMHQPEPAAELSALQIQGRLELPVGQVTIRELARGARRPVVVVDDLNRPTPAAQILPAVLAQLGDAGIAPEHVSIVMGPGTHALPPPDALLKKIGFDALIRCRPSIHDCDGRTVRLGRTSYGTPIRVNPVVAQSDFVIAIGGVYPNQTAGFGGGSKAALGVLGFHTIAALHYGHPGAGWGAHDGGTFRRDLDEIAARIGLRVAISVLVSGDRRVIDVRCGDPAAHYPSALAEARTRYRAPLPSGADVVIANAYPNDLSRTFVGMKALAPLRAAPPSASRVVIAACSEGMGNHSLFPVLDPPRFHRRRVQAARVDTLSHRPREVVQVLQRRMWRRGGQTNVHKPAELKHRHPIWLFSPNASHLPVVAGIQPVDSWEDIISAVEEEQNGRKDLRAAVYPCSPLQWLDNSGG